MVMFQHKAKAQEFLSSVAVDNSDGLPTVDTDKESLMSALQFPEVILGKDAWTMARYFQWDAKREKRREAALREAVIASTNTITGLKLARSGNSISFYTGEIKSDKGTMIGGRHAKSYTTEAFTLMRQNEDKISALYAEERWQYWQPKPETMYKGKPQPAVPAVLLHKPANTFQVSTIANGEAAEKLAAEKGIEACNPNAKAEDDDEGK